MVNNKIQLRLMEQKDVLYFVKDAREEFEEHGRDGDYFFFVIENTEGETIGFIIAKRNERRALVVNKIKFIKEPKEKAMYENFAIAELYQYAKHIYDSEGRFVYQVSNY